MKPYEIARVCHEANSMVRIIQKESKAPTWEELGPDEQGAIVNGVCAVLKHPNQHLSWQHDIWRLEKEKLGWIYGKELNRELKVHPNLVAWEHLPKEQQIKDRLFKAIVLALDE